MSVLRRLFWEEEGQGMVEYGLIIALVAVVAMVAWKGLGDGLTDILQDITGKLKDPSTVTAP